MVKTEIWLDPESKKLKTVEDTETKQLKYVNEPQYHEFYIRLNEMGEINIHFWDQSEYAITDVTITVLEFLQEVNEILPHIINHLNKTNPEFQIQEIKKKLTVLGEK